jgi:tetraacyldisaccharide 4'-kinase
VVTVGGATFGGSGKTPLAIACAVELARGGARTALVGHAYRAAPLRARVVSSADRLEEVGDEALLAARALEACGGRVVVAASRSAALELAAQESDVIVIDGVLQLAPSPAALALLAVDAEEPWRGRSLAGLPRAPRDLLLGACDALVPLTAARMGNGGNGGNGRDPLKPVWPTEVESRGAWANEGKLLTWETVRQRRVGLVTALARPERVVRGLERKGVFPRIIVRAWDHGPFLPGARRAVARALDAGAVDLWLATPKCALHAGRGLAGLPIAVLDHSLRLHPVLRVRLRGLSASARAVANRREDMVPPP